jgi:Protein of unknown function (DUF3108)
VKNSLILGLIFLILGFVLYGQSSEAAGTPSFRVGERLTYNISFGKFNEAGYAETFVVSRGKIGEKNAIELRGRFKTTDFVSAVFYYIDETRSTFASAESGLPLYSKITFNESVPSRDSTHSFLDNPTAYHDLLTALYQVRALGGSGSLQFQESDKLYTASTITAGNEKVATDIGEYDTIISSVQSQYLLDKGITNLRINLSNDDSHVPVLIRFKMAKGEFRAVLASVQMFSPETASEATPTPLPTPRPSLTPRPIVTPTPFVENQPLSQDLPFSLGETLSYKITSQNQLIANVNLQARERKALMSRDSLLLNASITNLGAGKSIFNLSDTVNSWVNPETLAPMQTELRLTGLFASRSQTVQFDQTNGAAVYGGATRVDVPVGTHDVLSLAYAIRSFNLTASKNPTNPVNDTRVAVFLGNKPVIFTLRPSTVESVEFEGKKQVCQVVSLTTGNPSIDAYNIRVWLTNDVRRLPLRFALGKFRADLTAVTIAQSR